VKELHFIFFILYFGYFHVCFREEEKRKNFLLLKTERHLSNRAWSFPSYSRNHAKGEGTAIREGQWAKVLTHSSHSELEDTENTLFVHRRLVWPRELQLWLFVRCSRDVQKIRFLPFSELKALVEQCSISISKFLTFYSFSFLDRKIMFSCFFCDTKNMYFPFPVQKHMVTHCLLTFHQHVATSEATSEAK
jgi:hypothetical protein